MSASATSATPSTPRCGGAPLRAIEEWMGNRCYKTDRIYADCATDPSHGSRWVEHVFGSMPDPAAGGLGASTPQRRVTSPQVEL